MNPLKVTVNRFTSDNDTTLSMVSIDNVFECFGLEDQAQEVKVAGETRIPAGVYQVGVRDVGGFHVRYSAKYPEHEGMLQVVDVPNFEYILIHVGNDHEDTAGCLLVGQGAGTTGKLTVQSSVNAYRALYRKVIKSAKAGNLIIEYIDND